MDEITILKSSFIISEKNVLPALEAIKYKYPEIIDHLKQPTIQHQFQFALYLFGYHVRIHNDGMMFGLRKLENSNNFASEVKYEEFFELLAPFTQPGSYIDLVANGIEKTIILKEENQYVTVPPEIEEINEIVIKEIDEAVAAEIANEIVPEVIRKEEKTMADIVAEAIRKADESLKKDYMPEVKKKPGRKPRVKK